MEGCVTIIGGDISRDCAGLEEEDGEGGIAKSNSGLSS
jgi:hypothetical protein